MTEQEIKALAKSIFIEHKGFNEVTRPTEVYQDIIHFEIGELVTIAGIEEKVKHRYSSFRREKKITIIRIQTL